MAVAFRSVATTTYASRTNTTVTAPAGIANDDILLATIFVGSSSSTVPTVTPPAGFTAFTDNPANSTNDGSFFGKLHCFWKRAASESGSYTFTHTTASSQCALIAISGAETSGSPVDAFSFNAVNVGGAAPTTATGITTTVANTLLCFLVHDWTATGALSPPTGFTEHSDSLVYTASKVQTATGATGNVTQNNGNPGGQGPWSARLVAIKPPGSVTNISVNVSGNSATAATSTPAAMTPTTIAVRSVASTTYSTRTDTVISPPSGIANGDILLAFMFVGAGGGGPPTPTPQDAGFTQVGSAVLLDPPGAGFAGNQYVWWKRAASESGNYGWTHTSADTQMVMLAIKNAKTSGSPIDVFSTNSATSGATITATGITTTAANDLVLYLASDWTGTGTLTPPSGFTEHFDGLVYAASRYQYAAGATGDVTQTNGNTPPTEPWGAQLVGILEATPSGAVSVNATGNSCTASTSTPTVNYAFKVNAATNFATASTSTPTVSTPGAAVGPSVRSVASTTYGSGHTNTVVSAPSGLANDDILLACIFVGAATAAPSVTPPTGFTELSTSPATGNQGSTFVAAMHVYWKRAASESGSYTFSHSSASSQCVMLAVKDCVTSGSPIDNSSVSTPADNTTTTAPGITTTNDNELLAYFGFDWIGSGTLNPPTGYTEQFDGLVYAATKTQATAGATGNVTQTNGNPGPGGAPCGAQLVALKPLVSGAAYPTVETWTNGTYTGRIDTTFSAPSGLADNDVMIVSLFAFHTVASPTVTPPSGWTEISGSPINVLDVSANNAKFHVYWKRAASESGSYTFSHSTSTTQGGILTIRGVATSGSPIDVQSSNSNSAGSTTSVTGITPTSDNTLLLWTGFDWTGSGALTPPTGFTERWDSVIYAATKAPVNAAATGTISMTNGNPPTGNPWGMFLLGIKPAVTSSGGVSVNASGNSCAGQTGGAVGSIPVIVNVTTNLATMSTSTPAVAFPKAVDVATNLATISTTTPIVSLPMVVNASGSFATAATQDVSTKQGVTVNATTNSARIDQGTPDTLAGGAISIGQTGSFATISTSNVTVSILQNTSTTLSAVPSMTISTQTSTVSGKANISPTSPQMLISTQTPTVNTTFALQVLLDGNFCTAQSGTVTVPIVLAGGFNLNPALSYSVHASLQNPTTTTTATINTGTLPFAYPNPFQFQDWSSNDVVAWVFGQQMTVYTGGTRADIGLVTIMVTSPQMTMSLGATFVTGVAQPRPPEKEGRMLALTNMMGS